MKTLKYPLRVLKDVQCFFVEDGEEKFIGDDKEKILG